MKVSVLIESLAGRKVSIRHAMALTQLKQRRGFNRTFQVQMQLGLGERPKKRAGKGLRHNTILPEQTLSAPWNSC